MFSSFSDFVLLGCILLFLDVVVVDSWDVNFACSNLIFQEVQIFFLEKRDNKNTDKLAYVFSQLLSMIFYLILYECIEVASSGFKILLEELFCFIIGELNHDISTKPQGNFVNIFLDFCLCPDSISQQEINCHILI